MGDNATDDFDAKPFLVGNADKDQKRGWFIGQFVDPQFPLRKRDEIEIKWGVHPAGDVRSNAWSLNRTSTTISVLIEGEINVLFRDLEWEETVVLRERGDYVIYQPGLQHTWYSEKGAVVLTIRTPSVKNDQEHFQD